MYVKNTSTVLLAIWIVGMSSSGFAGSQFDSVSSSVLSRQIDGELKRLLGRVQGESRKCATIFSQWHISNVAPAEKRSEREEALAFGKLMANRLTDWAAEARKPGPASEHRNRAELLLDLADWLGKSPGYGNAVLAARSQDIALTSIGRLVVDESQSLEDLKGLFDRLDAPWYRASFRMKILNLEAGAAVFSCKQGSEDAIQRALKETWQNGTLLALEQREKEMPGSRPGQSMASAPAFVREKLEAARKRARQSGIRAEHIPFFNDAPSDASEAGLTAIGLWKGKWHHRLVMDGALRTRNMYEVDALARFRAAVGHFPETKEGFDSAWRPHATTATWTLDAPAWRAYEKIKNGSLVDQDFELTKR